MRTGRIGKAALLAAGALAAAVTVAACSSSGGSAATGPTPASPTPTPTKAPPTMTVTPHTHLHDAQTVSVVGKGFTAGSTYAVTECANKGAATGAGDCDLRHPKVGTADATGTVKVQFTVYRGPFGANKIDCTKTPGCILSVANAGSASPTEVATEQISFAS